MHIGMRLIGACLLGMLFLAGCSKEQPQQPATNNPGTANVKVKSSPKKSDKPAVAQPPALGRIDK